MVTKRTVLSVFKLKAAIAAVFPKSTAGIVADAAVGAERDVALGDDGTLAKLFTATREPHHPEWTQFLEPVVADIGELLVENAANSAVLIVRLGATQLYAIAFGYGRHLLDDEAIVRGFGVRVALSLLDADKTRHVGFKQVEATTMYGDLQTSSATNFHTFALNPDAQILRGIQGAVTATDDRWGTHVLGTDAVQLNPRIAVEEVPAFLHWIESVDGGKKYQKEFKWIDYVVHVTDAALLAELELVTDHELRRTSHGLTLAIPEPVDHGLGPTFWYGKDKPTGTAHEDVSLADLHRQLPVLDVGTLRKHRVFVKSGSGEIVHRWFAWRCLGGEITHKSQRYVIQDGGFYQVDKRFEAKIDKRLGAFGGTKSRCVTWDRSKFRSEAAYNEKSLLASLGKKRAICIDADCLSTYRGHAQVELCDVFERKANGAITMFFIKKYDGASSPLSHLAAQAGTSADALRNDPDFVNDARRKWSLVDKAFVKGVPYASCEIRVGIATKGHARPLKDLPFFAKLTLVRRAEQVRQLGFSVAIETFPFT